MPTRSSSSVARARASWPRRDWWRRSTAPIWRPTVSTGLSEVIGSWNTYAMSRPRTSRSDGPRRPSSSTSSKLTEPVTRALAGSRPVSASAVTLLPQPDSPTSASTSRPDTSKLAESTASTGPSSVRKRTVRSRTRSTALPGVQRVAQPVPEQVQRERQRHNGHPREHRHPRTVAEQRLGAGQHDAERRCRWPDPKSQKGKHGLADDGGRRGDGGLHDQGVDRVGQDVAAQHDAVARAVGDGGG